MILRIAKNATVKIVIYADGDDFVGWPYRPYQHRVENGKILITY